MWNDVETTQDLLNFKVIADTVAQMIKDGNGAPVSIGVSGSWGTGKSSLVQMIGESIKNLDDNKNYIFVNFNAWLYQGYDDARIALLQKVADQILDEAENRKSCVEKVKEFIKRINWLKTAKIATPVITALISGGSIAGPIGSLIGAAGGLLNHAGSPNLNDLEKLKKSYNEILQELKNILDKEKQEKSIPKEIEELRELFKDLLEKLDLTLIVLVDDLDRCLPNTAISTLEAMRLLLFIPNTAFIIAADEQMIRNAVRSHFGNTDLSDELVTSYFDKLIQIPIRVPRLGINEVKGYLILLLADLAERKGIISTKEKNDGYNAIIGDLRKCWAGGLTKKMIEHAYGQAASKLSMQIDMADQLANTMVISDNILGNPRLIKRFLNNLIIRESIANRQGMSITFDALVKIQLFERCASASAFEYLVKQVGESENGKPKFLQGFEASVAKNDSLTFAKENESWNNSFVLEWLKLSPRLSNIDLRPLLYLSRDKTISWASFDELSQEGRDLLTALCQAKDNMDMLIPKLQKIDQNEADIILTRIKRIARNQQWELTVLKQALCIPIAHPGLAHSFISMLNEIPASARNAPLIPLLLEHDWAESLLTNWEQDEKTPQRVKKAITLKRKTK